MLRFDANLSMMFAELEPAKRFQAARKAGFTACEYLRPYSHTVAEMKEWLADAQLQLVLINSPLGAQGERGLGALPGRQADFRAAIDQALEYATSLGAGMVHVLAGVVPEGANRDEYEETFVANLPHVAPVARAKGVALLLEPLNQQDNPGYLHSTTAQARRIIA